MTYLQGQKHEEEDLHIMEGRGNITAISQIFDWKKFSRDVIESYGSLESPDYSFVNAYLAGAKHPGVRQFLEENYDFSEDTDPNTDVSYGYVLRGAAEDSVFRVSLVGPYYYLSSLSPDGSQQLPSLDLPSDDDRRLLLKRMEEMGMIFTPAEVLSKRLVFGNQSSSLYSILYCYEGEPSWIEGWKTGHLS
ncbi:hypothetical protein [Burkholderia lata]|uniref:hypothetical protein n=1 Tax=Burkholderia lata (strain ATCC 17760 / DSM 23089 / LMG 22485 / NCIMB 9086 / R18194 / 383) TaxID=482957 RepID=UPI00158332CA|nr:hypothetical protein [Burkholderia lata]